MATATAVQPAANPALKHVRCYDNGGKTADRYTVVYMHIPESRDCYGARGMNAHPFHPCGIGMYTSAQPGRHLGLRIAFEQLPSDCQKLVLQDLKED